MKSSVMDEFIKYAKEQFGYDIILKSSETPDTFASIFGASFLEQNNGFENVEYYENGLQYEENYSNVQLTTQFDWAIPEMGVLMGAA